MKKNLPAQKYIDQFGSAIGFGEEILQQYKLSEILPFIFGHVAEFEPKVKELKVFKEERELRDEAERLNKIIYKMREGIFWEDPVIKPVADFLFGNAVPVAPYPEIERCLGLNPRQSTMTIKNGYAVMAYDYSITKSTEDCLFRLKEWKAENEWAKQDFSI